MTRSSAADAFPPLQSLVRLCGCLLMMVCLGCPAPVSDEYQLVTPEGEAPAAPEPAGSAPGAAAAEQLAGTTSGSGAPSPADQPVPPAEPMPSTEKPGPGAGEQAAAGSGELAMVPAAALSRTEDLSIDESRPFAVPLPERIEEAPLAAASGGTTPGQDPLARIKLLIPAHIFVPEQGALRVTFDDIDLLRVLNMDPVPVNCTEYFPDWLSGLHGQQIRLRGWMYPPAKSEGISRFLFVRDSGLCCFGARPRNYDKVAVRLKPGVTTKHIVGRPFDVIGTLIIEPIEEDENELFLLYHIEDAVIAE
jgi:hypothetical protein